MRDYQYTKQEIVEAVQKFISVYGSDSKLYVKMRLTPSMTAIENYVGSWNDAVRLAGGVPKRHLTKEEIILYFSLTIAELGYLPSSYEYIQLGLNPSLPALKRHNLGWHEVIDLAGIPHAPRKNRVKDGYRQCPVCGTEFPITIGKRRYCHPNCRDRFKQWKYRTLRKLSTEKKCPQCGLDWIEPKETHRGKPKHCLRCQRYYQSRYKKAKSPR